MSAASLPHQEAQKLALAIHGILSDLDRGRRHRKDETLRTSKRKLEAIRARMTHVMQTEWAVRLSIAPKLHDLIQVSGSVPESATDSDWPAFRNRAHAAYEAMAIALRNARIHVPSLRPKNYSRNVMHVASALSCVAILELLPDWSAVQIAAVGGALFAWSLETLRRVSPKANVFLMWIFSKVAHPHEAHRVNSATWYATALAILALFATPPAAMIALLILGFGDPMAAVVGRRYGKTILVHGRSLEGTLAFAVTGAAVAFASLAIFHPEIGLGRAVAACFVGAVVGAITELVSLRVDDNFSIPVAVWASTALILA